MQRLTKLSFIFSLLFVLLSIRGASAADTDMLGNALRGMDNVSTFVELINIAGLDGFVNGQGNYTALVPTDTAFANLPEGDLATIKENPNNAREVVLYHMLNARHGSAALRSLTSEKSVLGPSVKIEPYAIILVDGRAQLIVTDVEAANAVIHILDDVLDPSGPITSAPPPSSDPQDKPESPTSLPDPDEPTPIPTATKPPGWVDPQDESDAIISVPTDNPAFIDGGYQEYWSGVMADSSTCKGMSWTLLQQGGGVTRIGSDRKTNPWRGDTSCSASLPILCIDQNFQGWPSSGYSDGWAYGRVDATMPVPGTRLTSRGAANGICQQAFGDRYRMAEFHDGAAGVAIGAYSGWDFWAYGGVEPGQRFWVANNDQPANPWDSVQPQEEIVLNVWASPIDWQGEDPAFVYGLRMMPAEGQSAPRTQCMGMTWVIHRQFNGLVEVGVDNKTNPYRGDTDCNQRMPVLCIKVEGYSVPTSQRGIYFNQGWSGANVNTTYPFSGHEINTRDKANGKCREAFGAGWRMAEFHDGALGQIGSEGWRFWAYGGLPIGRRMWVSINDQPANPWNPSQ